LKSAFRGDVNVDHGQQWDAIEGDHAHAMRDVRRDPERRDFGVKGCCGVG